MSIFYKYLFILVFFITLGCDNDPKPAVDREVPVPGTGVQTGLSEELTLIGVKYKGLDSAGKKICDSSPGDESCEVQECEVIVAMEPSSDRLLLKINHLFHGQNPSDSVVEFYKYSPQQDQYYLTSSDVTAPLAMVSALYFDKGLEKQKLLVQDIDFDPNHFTQYEADGILLQSVNVELTSSASQSLFLESLSNISGGGVLDAHNMELLNVVAKARVSLFDGNHYDPIRCVDLELKELGNFSFTLDHSGNAGSDENSHNHSDDDHENDDHGNNGEGDHNNDQDNGGDHDHNHDH